MKRKSKDIIVYNTLPDPLKSIKEYEYDSDTGRPKSDVLSRVNPLNFYGKEAPFGKGKGAVKGKELTFDPPEGDHQKATKKGGGLLSKAAQTWNKYFGGSHGKIIPKLVAEAPSFKGAIQKLKEKAFRDADDEMLPMIIPGQSTVVKQQVINNSGDGGSVIKVYTSATPMLT